MKVVVRCTNINWRTFNTDITQNFQNGGLDILSAQKGGITLCAVAFTGDVGRSFKRSLNKSTGRRSGRSILQKVYPQKVKMRS
jgi:hypothetical protein